MKNYNFGGQSSVQESQTSVLVGSAASAEVARFDTQINKVLSATVAVSVAALATLSVFGRTDTNARWIPIPVTELLIYARSDGSSDIGKTPAGVSAMLSVDATVWSQIKFEATSAGAASLYITAGIE